MLQVSTQIQSRYQPRHRIDEISKSIFATLAQHQQTDIHERRGRLRRRERDKRAAKETDQQNSTPTVIAVRPVFYHPPPRTGRRLDIQSVAGAAPTVPGRKRYQESVVKAIAPSIICPSLSSRLKPALVTARTPVASNTAVITSASTLGRTTGFNAPIISKGRSVSCRFHRSTKAWRKMPPENGR